MSEWEAWDEDEERVEEEEEEAPEDVERLDEDEEAVDTDEVVIASPEADGAELYVYGATGNVPKISGTRRWLEYVQSYKQYRALAEEARKKGDRRAGYFERVARRYGDLVFELCPYKPHRCPLYSFHKCSVGMERACRPRAWASRKPRKAR